MVQGATPLFFLDYIASSKLNIEDSTSFVKGCCDACKKARKGNTCRHCFHCGKGNHQIKDCPTLENSAEKKKEEKEEDCSSKDENCLNSSRLSARD